jgi:hypothetical protein
MTIFRCENPVLEKALVKLHELVVENGGYINENATFVEARGELSIISSLPRDNHEKLIILSDACLPRVNDFMITANNDNLFALPKFANIKESHVAIMRVIIEIFNITNKLSIHRETNPWLALERSPELIEKLLEVRAMNTRMQRYYEKYRSGEFGELLIDTFIGSRAVGFKSSSDEEPTPCMMPFIDFANHHCSCSGYQSSDDVLAISNCKPIPDSEECFVRYSMLDAIDTFMFMGFVDINATFVRSVPFRFDMPDIGSIQVETSLKPFIGGILPDSVKNLRAYMPFVSKSDDVMRFSHLHIPGEGAPRALRRVLAFYVQDWKPDLDSNAVKDIVLSVEEEIINKNLEYYKSLLSLMEAIDPAGISPGILQSVETLAEYQTKKLQQYHERREDLGDRISWSVE